MKVADIYLRVSSKPQLLGDGMCRQEESCRDWCRENGIRVRRCIRDCCSAWDRDGGLGYNLEHGNMATHIVGWRRYWHHHCGKSFHGTNLCGPSIIPPDYLVVECLDRFSRGNPLLVVCLVDELAQMGTRVTSVYGYRGIE